MLRPMPKLITLQCTQKLSRKLQDLKPSKKLSRSLRKLFHMVPQFSRQPFKVQIQCLRDRTFILRLDLNLLEIHQ
ncbi:MAG: hypothetical protein CMJ52_08815 [Planctomycetaceae bacterium]|nr:hypothetical protein [Planctomycetaceae bacterium]